MLALVITFMNCKKPDDPDSPNNPNNLKEGINLTILAFNNGIKYKKDFTLVDENSAASLKSWIDNLNQGDGTALFYAIDSALNEIKKAKVPSNLNSVSVVTFTDGIDNASVGFNSRYNNRAEYQEAIRKRISTEKFHNFQAQAYGIGVPSADVGNQIEEFNKAIRDISSTTENTFILNNFSEVQAKFAQIARSLTSYNTTTDLTFKISFGGTDDICLVFDGLDYSSSQCKIQAKVNSDRSFSNIQYTGLTSSSGSTVQGLNPDGALYHYTFTNIKKTDGTTPSDSEIKNVKLYKSSLGWGIDTEFNPASASNTTVNKKSAAIALVLDISSSLGSDLANVKAAAKSFIDVLASNTNGGGGNSGGSGFWTKKADFIGEGGNNPVGFSIGNKGYIGMGFYLTGNYAYTRKDFWEYNPISNTLTQKADFTGSQYGPIGLSIGNNGYAGFGNGENDFWEYNPTLNTWTQKAALATDDKRSCVSFSIGDKGYVGTGGHNYRKDFWEYDPVSNTWTQKADFAGGNRTGAVGFSIGDKGYVGMGSYPDYYTCKQDFWEYNPVSNTWTQKANFAGGNRTKAVGFSIGNKGYVGTGYNGSSYYKDFWEYNPTSNTWTQKANFAGGNRRGAVGFSIGNKGYVGVGDIDGNSKQDFWEFTP